ncbi:short-chain dehydrogenase [Rhodococcus sp. WMMA185]|uniref:SDR family NAD(P)-dependent oxidoreductase n=1 Tax=Rhodococcus sp. WMMA185 TaxID=679318 RepID=UPI00087843D6|nr:glucose 1-dehydrogenase [Rhodococcus sp. WMMA185]AOW94100.1 short-chain dehydrogenase [Rhodococcus sp. WMMA185]
MSELANRTAIVTGGTSGIGLGAVERLLAHGASVAFCGIDAEEAEQSAKNLAGEYGDNRVFGRVADVRDADAVQSFVADSAERFGGLDIVVTAAGIQTYGSAADTDPATWERTLAVNVTGSYLAVKHAIPHLRRRGGGSIVLVSSVQAFVCQEGVSSYTASKGALNALARSIAIDEARHGIRANTVCPASVDTPMLRASARQFSDGTPAGEQALVDQWGTMHPLGRVAQPSEIGEAIAFLSSDRASFITGISLPVDGGMLASIPVALPE